MSINHVDRIFQFFYINLPLTWILDAHYRAEVSATIARIKSIKFPRYTNDHSLLNIFCFYKYNKILTEKNSFGNVCGKLSKTNKVYHYALVLKQVGVFLFTHKSGFRRTRTNLPPESAHMGPFAFPLRRYSRECK